MAINLLSTVPDRDRDRDGAADTAAAARMSVAKTNLQTIFVFEGRENGGPKTIDLQKQNIDRAFILLEGFKGC